MPNLYSIGHSARSLQEFLDLLDSYHITCLVDVRTIPKSRRFPWFNKTALAKSLKKKKIAYIHLPELGGLRHTRADSINQGWHNKSFRGFADYMQTPEFYAGLKTLMILLKSKKRVAVMCAEAVPWRCHRSLIADALLVRKIHVYHILSKSSAQLHELTSFAKVDRDRRPIKVYYP